MTFKKIVSNEGSDTKPTIQKQEPDNDPIFFSFFGGGMMNENRQQQLLNREIGND